MESISLEYIWIGANDTYNDLRSKTRTVSIERIKGLSFLTFDELNERLIDKIPEWNFDGSSTGQADSEHDTEIILKPCCVCLDPFRTGQNQAFIVLCDCYIMVSRVLVPHSTNSRFKAVEIFKELAKDHPWFGLEQEYVLTTLKGRPLGWPMYDMPERQGKYYCGTGTDKIFMRAIIEKHYQTCLYAGLTISGYNAEVMPGQYEFQIGPVEGIRGADQLILARYFLARVAEEHQVLIDYSPKPQKGEWNGSGLHHNYSNETMRAKDGIIEITKAIQRLAKKHKEHLDCYGTGNAQRLTGNQETSSMEQFSFGIGTRNTSIRIPNMVSMNKCGYLEDRRPASNCDPYLTTSILAKTCSEQ